MSPNAARFLIAMAGLFAINWLYDGLFGYDSVFYPQPSWEQRTVSDVEEVRGGTRRLWSSPHPSIFASAVDDEKFVRYLRELTLFHDLSEYSKPVQKLVNLKKVVLGHTQNTAEFLKSLPSGLTSLVLDGTDLFQTKNEGLSRSKDHSARIRSRMQLIADLESLEELFICAWDDRFTAPACECFPQLQSLRKLKIEWGTESDIAALRAALPNCRVILVTEH